MIHDREIPMIVTEAADAMRNMIVRLRSEYVENKLFQIAKKAANKIRSLTNKESERNFYDEKQKK